MISARAIRPATKTDPRSRSISNSRPANAPSAPASFQSPAPRLRSRTKGSRSPRPTSAPMSDEINPFFPPRIVFVATPASKPETVSQFGIRRLRKSVQPAIRDSSTAPPKMMGFNLASVLFGRRPGLSPNDIEEAPFVLVSSVRQRRRSHYRDQALP